jgi:hypothetical protein
MLEIVFVVFDFNYLGTYREPSFSDPDPLLCGQKSSQMKETSVRPCSLDMINLSAFLIIGNLFPHSEVYPANGYKASAGTCLNYFH